MAYSDPQEDFAKELCEKIRNGMNWAIATEEFRKKFNVSVTYMLGMGYIGLFKKAAGK